MHILEQEIEVWYIIPAIRREIAKSLVKDHELSYEKAGNLLGVSKAAITQYVKSKRAAKVKLHDKVVDEIVKSTKKMVSGKSNSVMEINRVLAIIKKKGLASEVCDKIKEGVLEDCKELSVIKIK